jgi:hypothetical protein
MLSAADNGWVVVISARVVSGARCYGNKTGERPVIHLLWVGSPSDER